MNYLNGFFNLGNKATRGNPVNKAKFDYYLYWIVFLAFIGLLCNYIYSFYYTMRFSYLMWGLIMGVISWFNYWGLLGFKSAYDNIKGVYENCDKKNDLNIESEGDMLNAFN